MRFPWLLAGVIGAAGLLAVRRRGSLGKTARKGKRTGAIEVNDDDVDLRVSQLLRQFDKCDLDEDGVVKGLQPLNEGSADPLSVVDAETGERRLVYVLLRPKPDKIWVDGGGVARIWAKRGHLQQEIHVEPNSKVCKSREAWEPFIRKVLVHEAGHSSDPALIKPFFQKPRTVKRRRKEEDADVDFKDYVNSPAETTAQLVEVEHELRRSMRTQPGIWKDPDPLDVLRAGSERYASLESQLTPRNKKRYQRLSARIVEERLAKRSYEDSDTVFRRMRIDAYRDKYAGR